MKDRKIFNYVFRELVALGVNSKELEWDISSILLWCKDFRNSIHYPINHGDKINGKDIHIEGGGVDSKQFQEFMNICRVHE